jgi:class 3 adenylate cyclase
MSATTFVDPFLRRELRGVPQFAARGAAGALSAFALLLFIRGIPGALARASERGQLANGANGGDPWLEPASVLVTWIGIAAAMVWCALAALILWRRSRDPFGVLLALGFVAIGLILASPDQILVGGGSVNSRGTDEFSEVGRDVVWVLTAFGLPWVFAFPDGRLVPKWSVVIMVPWIVWALLRIPFPDELSHARYGLAGSLLYIAFPLTALAAQVYRFGWRSDAVQRQQLKWFMYGGVLIVAAWITAVIVASVLDGAGGSTASGFIGRTASAGWLAAASMLMPVTIAIAIFRQGLLNIDLLINRTVMYSLLTIMLVAAFVVIGTLAQRAYAAIAGQQSDLVSLTVAMPIALAFLPLRARMQSIADHFLSDRAILTILFLDLVGSTAHAAAVGDRAWRELLERYRSAVRREIRRHGGREIDTAGDGFFVTFGSPGAAIGCARAAVASVRTLGLEARAGLHIGECEVQGGRVTGIGVHIGARIVAAAGAGEILVSRTLRDLVAGSDIRLGDRGLHRLKGIPGRWHLYSVAPS